MDTSLNPGNRPRKGPAVVLAALGLLAVATVVAVSVGDAPAGASGLATFSSCRELTDWGTESQAAAAATGRWSPVGGELASADKDGAAAASGAPATTIAAGTAADSATARTSQAVEGDGTNVVVAGVDELDVVDHLDGDRVLLASSSALTLVDLAEGRALARHAVPAGAQLTYDAAAGIVWVVGTSADGTKVEVERVAVDGDALEPAGTWSTAGTLVDARRIGDRLHLVASDGFGPIATERTVVGGATAVAPPFAGGPVPCDRVLHPVGPSDPTATLLVTLPVDGDLAPVASTEVVGSGQLVHVTTEAAYLATPQWGTDVTTTIHRFALDGLVHTGSGRVAGTLLDEFSMSEHDGHLRVATTEGGGRVGGPLTMEGDVAVDGGPASDRMGTVVPTPAPDGPTVDPGADPAAGQAPDRTEATEVVAPPVAATVPQTVVPETTVPETTVPGPTTTEPATTSVPETTTTVPETTTTTEAVPETTVPETTTTTGPEVGPDDARNRVVVLDTDGDLDLVGLTPRFGHPGEALQGIRFDGAVAYAVTFLQTDPFYVLDLADPTAPRIDGEVELPGFSSYLHPLGDGTVVGFGPDGDGRASAKLFDVSDPTAPKVVDSVVLGDESAITFDHHAFVDLGDGRFAVPASTWRTTFPERCTPAVQAEAQQRQQELETRMAGPDGSYAVPEGEANEVARQMESLAREGCLYPGSTSDSSVVVLEASGGQLTEIDRQTTELADSVARALPSSAGWSLLGGSSLALLDPAGAVRATLDLS